MFLSSLVHSTIFTEGTFTAVYDGDYMSLLFTVTIITLNTQTTNSLRILNGLVTTY